MVSIPKCVYTVVEDLKVIKGVNAFKKICWHSKHSEKSAVLPGKVSLKLKASHLQSTWYSKMLLPTNILLRRKHFSFSKTYQISTKNFFPYQMLVVQQGKRYPFPKTHHTATKLLMLCQRQLILQRNHYYTACTKINHTATKLSLLFGDKSTAAKTR